jgi:uncharacterized protein (TIGR02246 family)
MTTDDRQIRDLFDRFMQAWADNDPARYVACFTFHADYVSYDGSRTVGRAAMYDHFDQLFRGVLAGSRLVGDIESIRFVSTDVAIVHGTASVLMPWRSRLPRRRLSRQTMIAVRTEQGWMFSAAHNGRVRPMSIPTPESMPSRMSHAMAVTARRLRPGKAVRTRGRGHRPSVP